MPGTGDGSAAVWVVQCLPFGLVSSVSLSQSVQLLSAVSLPHITPPPPPPPSHHRFTDVEEGGGCSACMYVVVARILLLLVYVWIIIYGCLTEVEEEGGCAACMYVCCSLYCFYWYICVYHELWLLACLGDVFTVDRGT